MSDRPPLHPRQALFGARAPGPVLPVCDHYAGEPARMEKSLRLQGAQGDRARFDVTLDLEDGAAVGRETEQLARVVELVASSLNRFNRVGVRVHDATSAHFDNDVLTLLHAVGQRVAYLMVPKVDDVAQARAVLQHVRQTALDARRTAAPPVHFLIETPLALHHAFAIAALPGVESLSFGLMDFVSAHALAIPASAMTASGQFAHPLVLRAKLEIAAACHAHGKTPSHSVVTEYKDTAALRGAAQRACSQLGYTRMWSIHPDQIDPIVQAFAPSARDVEDAAQILLAARDADWGPIAHHDTLHDRASYRLSWSLLERAWHTGQPLPEAARHAFFEDNPK